MPIYLVVAYVIFCVVPLGLGLGIQLRYRRLTHDIELIERSTT